MTMVTTHVPAKYNQELESAMSYDAPDLAFSTLLLLLSTSIIIGERGWPSGLGR